MRAHPIPLLAALASLFPVSCGGGGAIQLDGILDFGEVKTAALAKVELTWEGGGEEQELIILANQDFSDEAVASLTRMWLINTNGSIPELNHDTCAAYQALYQDFEDSAGAQLTEGAAVIYLSPAVNEGVDTEDDRWVQEAQTGDYVAGGGFGPDGHEANDFDVVAIALHDDPARFWLDALDCSAPRFWDPETSDTDLLARRSLFISTGDGAMSLKRSRAGKVRGAFDSIPLFEAEYLNAPPQEIPTPTPGDEPTPTPTATPLPLDWTPAPETPSPTLDPNATPTATPVPSTPVPPDGHLIGEFDARAVEVSGSFLPE